MKIRIVDTAEPPDTLWEYEAESPPRVDDIIATDDGIRSVKRVEWQFTGNGGPVQKVVVVVEDGAWV